MRKTTCDRDFLNSKHEIFSRFFVTGVKRGLRHLSIESVNLINKKNYTKKKALDVRRDIFLSLVSHNKTLL